MVPTPGPNQATWVQAETQELTFTRVGSRYEQTRGRANTEHRHPGHKGTRGRAGGSQGRSLQSPQFSFVSRDRRD